MERRYRLTKEIVDPTSDYSHEEVEALFQTARAIWDASTACTQLKSILSSTTSNFSKVIGFACSSMGYDHKSRETRRAAFQHALLLTLQEELSKKQNNSSRIPCYAQDPIYTTADKLVLNRANITVLDDPKGFLEVDNSTVLFSSGPNVPVKEIVMDLALPLMMIWDEIPEDGPEWMPLLLDANPPRVRDLARNCYERLDFPGDAKHFGYVAIYIRQTVLPLPC